MNEGFFILACMECSAWSARSLYYGIGIRSQTKEGKMNEQEMREWINKASYKELLSRWRFSPSGSPWFQGELGQHYEAVMRKRKEEVGDEQHVAISKNIGWG